MTQRQHRFYLTLNACRDKSITVRIHRWDDPNGRGEFMDRTYGLANSGPNGEIDSTIQIAWLQAKSKMS